jgi:stearoyl-CoA desaturase (delta-9 desaturase)
MQARTHVFGLIVLQTVAHLGFFSMLFWAAWWHWLIVVLVYFLMGSVGASVVLHRLLSHRSFVPQRWFVPVGVACANLAGIGSSIAWTAVHRAHHHHTDQNSSDPHSPHHHSWQHVVWLGMTAPVQIRYVKDLLREPLHVWWHKWYFVVHVFCAGVLLLVSWKLLMCAYLAPMAITWSMGGALNWVNHKWGYRNHIIYDHSTNNWIFALLYWGEGWHNNHHASPKKWNFGEQWWEIDISGMIIKLLKKMD